MLTKELNKLDEALNSISILNSIIKKMDGSDISQIIEYQKVIQSLRKVSYGDFESFEKDIKQDFALDFLRFGDINDWLQTQDFQKFRQSILKAKKYLPLNNEEAPNEDVVKIFYMDLFRNLVEDEGGIKESQARLILFPERLSSNVLIKKRR